MPKRNLDIIHLFDPPRLNRLEESEFINFWGKPFQDRGVAAGLKKTLYFKSFGLGQGEFTLRVSRFYSAQRRVKAAVNKLGQVCHQFVCSFRVDCTFDVPGFEFLFFLMVLDVDPFRTKKTQKRMSSISSHFDLKKA